MGKSDVYKLETILKDKIVTKKTKIIIAETLVLPIVRYGSEILTVRKDREKPWYFLTMGMAEYCKSDRKENKQRNFAENETKHLVRKHNWKMLKMR